MLIGLIADTHIPHRQKILPRQVFELFDGVDLILHAGDISSENVLHELEILAPVLGVHGNADPPELVDRLPPERIVNLKGYRVGLTHGHLLGSESPPSVVS